MATSPNSALHEALMLYREMSGGVEVVSDATRASILKAIERTRPDARRCGTGRPAWQEGQSRPGGSAHAATNEVSAR